MVASLSFEPLADNEATHTIESTNIDLPTENKLYVLGFRRNPLKSDNGELTEIGFTDTVEDDKFCIVPVESEDGQKIKDPFAVIWLAPGYKVMIIPAEGSKIYYQRAVSDNIRWTRIKNGWGFDLADPLLTALDGAIHVKFDTRPDNRRRAWFKSKLEKYTKRRREHAAVVKHIEAGTLEGAEKHEEQRAHQISAKVSVFWGRDTETESFDALKDSSRPRSKSAPLTRNPEVDVSECLPGERMEYTWGYDSDAESLYESGASSINSNAKPDVTRQALQNLAAHQEGPANAPRTPATGASDYISAQTITNTGDDGLDSLDFISADEEHLMTPRPGPIASSYIERSNSHHLQSSLRTQSKPEEQASFYNDSKP